MDINKFFMNSELIPVIIQEYGTDKVLMLGYMNKESLKLTVETGRTWFYSRSRQTLWNKGETTGHFQDVKEIYYDCDVDTLLIKAEQTGVVCHTGEDTCFFNRLI